MGGNERLDKAFTLIGEGNQKEEEENYWQAANCFGDAMRLLFQLAVELEPKTEEEQKIEDLYQSQCREYLHRARNCFVQALSQEDEVDRTTKDNDPKFITLTNEEARERVQLFSTLFSKELELDVEDLMAMPDPTEIAQHQSTLEDRLRSLNDSMPASMKTEEERMKEIDRGLKGLGVNLYSETTKPKLDLDIPVSKEEQMASIIAQAKDEARYDSLYGKKDAVDDDSVILTDESSLEEDNADNDADDDSFIPKLRNKKAIHRYAVNAQVKLAQLIALLDVDDLAKVTPKKAEKEDGKDDNEEDDQEEEGTSPAEKAQSDLDQGKTLLLKATKNLSKAIESWEVEM